MAKTTHVPANCDECTKEFHNLSQAERCTAFRNAGLVIPNNCIADENGERSRCRHKQEEAKSPWTWGNMTK